VTTQLGEGCYPLEWWHGRNANPGPLGPNASALTTVSSVLTV